VHTIIHFCKWGEQNKVNCEILYQKIFFTKWLEWDMIWELTMFCWSVFSLLFLHTHWTTWSIAWSLVELNWYYLIVELFNIIHVWESNRRTDKTSQISTEFCSYYYQTDNLRNVEGVWIHLVWLYIWWSFELNWVFTNYLQCFGWRFLPCRSNQYWTPLISIVWTSLCIFWVKQVFGTTWGWVKMTNCLLLCEIWNIPLASNPWLAKCLLERGDGYLTLHVYIWSSSSLCFSVICRTSKSVQNVSNG